MNSYTQGRLARSPVNPMGEKGPEIVCIKRPANVATLSEVIEELRTLRERIDRMEGQQRLKK